MPSVSVPVLSTTSVSIFRIVSIASALRKSTPERAAFPVATMMAIGVASPSAQGQAMIRTATALIRAWAIRGDRAPETPDGESHNRDGDDGRNEIPGDDVREFLDGGTRALGIRDHPNDLREHRFGPDPLGAKDDRARAVHGRPDQSVPGLLLHRNRLAGDHRFVDGRCPFEDDPVHGHLLARAHPHPVAHLHLLERNVRFGPIRTDAARRLRRETQERLDRRARSAARRKLQHLPEKDERDDDGRRFEIDADLPRGDPRKDGGKIAGNRAATRLYR